MAEATGDQPETMRIARYLARCGVASRRKSEDLVSAGRVKLNGEVIRDLGRQVHVGKDQVEVNGRPLKLAKSHLTLVYNKPQDVLVTKKDTHDRRTVFDLLPKKYWSRKRELIHAGRLDYQTTGLLVLTTDGDLANQLIHPSNKIEKEYYVATKEELNMEMLQMLRDGVKLEDGIARAVRVDRINWPDGGRLPTYSMVLEEGRKRQVRRMFQALGMHVIRLHRERIGALSLTGINLPRGIFLEMDEDAVATMLNIDVQREG